jgi:hypothetical protein
MASARMWASFHPIRGLVAMGKMSTQRHQHLLLDNHSR